MSVNATFDVAARTRKVSQRSCTHPTTGNILILHKTLPTWQVAARQRDGWAGRGRQI